LIIAILLPEFVQSGPVRARGLEIHLKPERGKQLSEFSEAQLAGPSVLESIERRPTYASLTHQLGLAKLELLAMFGDLGPKRD
jgi:hypothetical protein